MPDDEDRLGILDVGDKLPSQTLIVLPLGWFKSEGSDGLVVRESHGKEKKGAQNEGDLPGWKPANGLDAAGHYGQQKRRKIKHSTGHHKRNEQTYTGDKGHRQNKKQEDERVSALRQPSARVQELTGLLRQGPRAPQQIGKQEEKQGENGAGQYRTRSLGQESACQRACCDDDGQRAQCREDKGDHRGSWHVGLNFRGRPRPAPQTARDQKKPRQHRHNVKERGRMNPAATFHGRGLEEKREVQVIGDRSEDVAPE